MPNRVKRIMLDTMESLNDALSKCEDVPVLPNLSKVESKALRQLVEDKDLVVTKADKGDSVVVLPTSRYLALAHEHLSDNKTYKFLRGGPNARNI